MLAHEYGHHVQNLLGTSDQVQPGERAEVRLGAPGAAGGLLRGGVGQPRREHADVLGQAADHRRHPGRREAALDAASRIGDDYIQRELGGGTVDTTQFTHGSSTQRQKWYTTGYRTGDPNQCNTFQTNDLG